MSFSKNSFSQQRNCQVCLKQLPASFSNQDAPICSIRCERSAKLNCVQCNRVIAGNTREKQSVYCGFQCADESRRGNWCAICGVSPCPSAGITKCTACLERLESNNSFGGSSQTAALSTSPSMSSITNSSAPSSGFSSGFSSRNTTPEEARRSATVLDPSDKVYGRIASQFTSRGLQVAQIVQLNCPPGEKKAYLANRLAVDQRLTESKSGKFGMGGEGNEHKRFLPLMTGCAQAWNQAVQGPACQDPSCDCCRILQSGLKLSSLIGRTSHFSLPNLESVLPWCLDAGKASHSAPNTRLCAVALTRVVVGVPQIVIGDLSQVAPPAVGFDSVIHMEKMGADSDSCFSFSDYAIQAEYICFFAAPTGNAAAAAPQQQQQQQPQQQGGFATHASVSAPHQNFYIPTENGQRF